MELTLPECVRVNAELQKAAKEHDAIRLIDILGTLRASDCKGKLKILAESKLGSSVDKLRKNEDQGVARAAGELKKEWAARVAAAKDAAATKAKAERPPEPKPAPAPAVKAESSSSGGRLVPTGDPTREMVRSKLAEAFAKGVLDNEKFLRGMDEVPEPRLMAQDAENAMYEHYDGAGKDYKARFRSLCFNLRDAKNPEFLRTVVTGQRHVTDLASMEVKDMASAVVQGERIKWQENAKMALMDDKTFAAYTGQTLDDGILKCPKCKSMKTEYTEVQTRSADEPTTKKCFCNACTYRWKFC